MFAATVITIAGTVGLAQAQPGAGRPFGSRDPFVCKAQKDPATFAMDGADISDPEMGGSTFPNFNVDAVERIDSSSGWMASPCKMCPCSHLGAYLEQAASWNDAYPHPRGRLHSVCKHDS